MALFAFRCNHVNVTTDVNTLLNRRKCWNFFSWSFALLLLRPGKNDRSFAPWDPLVSVFDVTRLDLPMEQRWSLVPIREEQRLCSLLSSLICLPDASLFRWRENTEAKPNRRDSSYQTQSIELVCSVGEHKNVAPLFGSFLCIFILRITDMQSD